MGNTYAYIEPSAWTKRYFDEEGSGHINTIFGHLLTPRPSHLVCSRIGISEVISVLNRHRNAGNVTQSIFNVAYAHFERETRMIRLVAVTNYQLDMSIRLLLIHNLNATDALHLQVALDTHSTLRRAGHHFLFFSADKRLIQAAQKEGLATFNPETGTHEYLQKLLDQ